MTPRSAAELDLLTRQLGTDLELRYLSTSGMFEDADVEVVTKPGQVPRIADRDMSITSGIPAATQLLANRLKAHRGELAPLGHPEYGSRHHELIGQPNVERTRNLVKLHVLEALSHEPRIAEILDCRVYAPHDPPRDIVRIELEVLLIGELNPLNLVVPFSLETAA